MSRSKDFLLVTEEMSVDIALKTLGLTKSDLGDEEKIKKAFHAASMKAHPDRGGSNQEMMNVIDANKVLTKSTGKSTSIDWKELDKEYKELGIRVRDHLLKIFKPELFVDYFKKLTGLDFKYIINARPSATVTHVTYAGLDVEFYTQDKKETFDFSVTVTLSDIKRGGSLSSPDSNYPLVVTSYGFVANRKQKLTQNNYNTNTDRVLSNPELIFPEKKVKQFFTKGGEKQFRKADMEVALKKLLGAKLQNEWAWIPISGDYTLLMYRIVFRGIAGWSPNGLYLKNKRLSTLTSAAFPESEKTVEKLRDMVQKLKSETDPDKMASSLINDIKQYKQEV